MILDIVFTYVDSNDIEWNKKKNNDLKIKNEYNNRYNSNLDEIKYSIKSIEKYFKNKFRNIYFVTNNGKLPKCIQPKKNYIAILYSDLVGNRTYNSNSIESSLHKINGLSEYYLYFNDDFILADYINISDFISNDGKLIWYEESNEIFKFANKNPIITNLCNFGDNGANASRNKLYKKFNMKEKPNPIAHSPRIFKKSMVLNFCYMFKKEIEIQRKKLFRTDNDFPFVDAFCFYFLEKKKLIYSNKYKTLLLVQFDNPIISLIWNKNIKDEKFICIEDARKGQDIDKYVLFIISNYFEK